VLHYTIQVKIVDDILFTLRVAKFQNVHQKGNCFSLWDRINKNFEILFLHLVDYHCIEISGIWID
jgi:hypothetical protein